MTRLYLLPLHKHWSQSLGSSDGAVASITPTRLNCKQGPTANHQLITWFLSSNSDQNDLEGLDSWTTATGGQSKHCGFAFEELSCCSSFWHTFDLVSHTFKCYRHVQASCILVKKCAKYNDCYDLVLPQRTLNLSWTCPDLRHVLRYSQKVYTPDCLVWLETCPKGP